MLANALERRPEQRRVYLDQVCSDPDLRREVESLIAAHEQGDTAFMELPAVGTTKVLQVGAKLGPYEILGLLGTGGMGEVYRARDTRLDRIVAIKILPDRFSDRSELRERFEREARTIASLNHPHICTLYDIGHQDRTDYLVMECLEGETLAEKLAKGLLPLDQVLRYAIEISDALDKAHQKGVTHRDLKPGNIMVTKSGAKLLDFGLAKLRHEASSSAAPLSQLPTAGQPITAQGTIVGTLQYMAPEQLEGKEVDARTDIFAFGAVMYEMATGKRAFEGKSQASIMAKILEIDPPPILTLQPMTPPALDRAVKTCLAKEPDERWQTARDLCRELRWIAGSGSQIASSTGKQGRTIDSLAILPLENASGDPETEYLSDGIAETLINTLAQLRKIRVVPRTLSFQYRGTGSESLKAGRELGVRAVLAGRMIQRGDDLTVSVELVDVERQAQLWGGRYNRKMGALIALQEELTTEIAEKLRLQLTGDEKKKLRKRPTQNNEAYKLVLKARYAASKLSPEAMRQAIAFCEQAVHIDPTYATGYAALSALYNSIGMLGYVPAGEIYPRAKAVAKKALDLDESLAEPHCSLGVILATQSWDFSGAELEFRRSVELNPDYAGGHSGLALLNRCRGHFDDAIAGFKRARDLEPLLGTVVFNLGITYYAARQFDSAIEEYRKLLEVDPGNAFAHAVLATVYADAGQRQKAIEECEQAVAIARNATVIRLSAATVYASIGNAEEARKILEEAESAWQPGDPLSFFIAATHARLGEKEEAFEWLEKSFQQHESFLTHFKVFPLFDALHGDPRFDDLVKRIGIPD